MAPRFDPRMSGAPLSPRPLGLGRHASVPVSRRAVLGGGLGLSVMAALSACGGGGSGAAAGDGTGAITLGSNQSDAVPKAAYQKIVDAFIEASGSEVGVNTVDHNTFQEQINSYLQGDPDDVFTWFAGYRMRFFADQGLAGDISSVWENIGGNFNESFKEASTGSDGKQYFVPVSYYPWAVFYRKSVFEENGYSVPTTLDEYIELAEGMKSDGLTPIGFADKGGWEAMGTFDILNMRINGYDFHTRLLAGEESWETDPVKEVFNTWARLLPYHQEGALGRDWQEAAQGLLQKKSGTYLLGMFVSQQFQDAEGGEALEDLDFFTFPEVNPEHGTDSIDAPIDGFMMSAQTQNAGTAKALLEFLGTPEAQKVNTDADKGLVAPVNGMDTSGYTALQQKASEVVGEAAHIAQFLDRDTRPDFASTVMIPSLQAFIREPGNIDSVLADIEAQKKAIFAG
ncbi:ABC transporter substrate-binding protein [Zafaria sp. Z1313]|uniref:ABC transporter substrate-binding protein n=1 Tax=unclassified Zafaria TaxID=2828765 RepID=UPI002E75B89C|nr:ABC transporter substrate-binding protein [Zafaria sp. J156]MEE1621538.1 ABC transporter substrate-binding protein [Zafaria sp. J156]